MLDSYQMLYHGSLSKPHVLHEYLKHHEQQERDYHGHAPPRREGAEQHAHACDCQQIQDRQRDCRERPSWDISDYDEACGECDRVVERQHDDRRQEP